MLAPVEAFLGDYFRFSYQHDRPSREIKFDSGSRRAIIVDLALR